MKKFESKKHVHTLASRVHSPHVASPRVLRFNLCEMEEGGEVTEGEGAPDHACSRGVKRPLEEPASVPEPRPVRQEVRAALCLEQ